MRLGSILGRWSKLKKVEKKPESLDDDTASGRTNPEQIKKKLNQIQKTLSKDPPPKAVIMHQRQVQI